MARAGGSAGSYAGSAYNGRGLTPTWGFNTYYAFGVNGFDHATLLDVAQAARDTGLWRAGYRMMGIDDGWSASERTAGGDLMADPVRFPDGIAATVARLHELGFTAGIYGDMGTLTCASRPGSYGYETQDAQWFADQGIDYIKMDWCNCDGFDAPQRYAVMSAAVLATGRPMTLSVCCWGRQQPWTWAPAIANSARTSTDIDGLYLGDGLPRPNQNYAWACMLKNLEANQHPEATGPGYANDPDCLRVGNGFFQSATDELAQLHLWAVMGAPMLLGLDPRSLSDELRSNLVHPMLAAVGRDSAAVQGRRVKATQGSEVWVKPLADRRSYAVVMFNRRDEPSTASVTWQELWRAQRARVRNLWTDTDLGTVQRGLETPLEPHATSFLQVTPL